MAITSLNCKFCHRTFPFNQGDYWHLGYSEAPQACPTCTDLRQGRPQIVLDRTELAVFTVKNELDADLKFVRVDTGRPGRSADSDRNKDRSPWRLTIKGSEYGAAWAGRIDLWCVTEFPPLPGNNATFKQMKVRTLVGKKAWSRQTLEHGEVEGFVQIPLHEVFDIPRFSQENLRALVGQREDAICAALQALPSHEGCEWMIEDREYLVLNPVKIEGDFPSLLYVSATTKTTFKGFGRQYWASIDASETLWHWDCQGGVRSGRRFTKAALAIVDSEHPIRATHEEDGEETVRIFPAPVEEHQPRGGRGGRGEGGPRPPAGRGPRPEPRRYTWEELVSDGGADSCMAEESQRGAWFLIVRNADEERIALSIEVFSTQDEAQQGVASALFEMEEWWRLALQDRKGNEAEDYIFAPGQEDAFARGEAFTPAPPLPAFVRDQKRGRSAPASSDEGEIEDGE